MRAMHAVLRLAHERKKNDVGAADGGHASAAASLEA